MTRFLVQSRVSVGNVHECLLKSRIGKVSRQFLRSCVAQKQVWALGLR
jgi:hypothetical protein